MSLVTLVWSPGTGESWSGDRRKTVLETGTMGTALVRTLGDRVYGAWAGYDASFGLVGRQGIGGQSHRDSRAIGKARMLEVARAHEGPLLLGGYSQGAEVSWELMQEMLRGAHLDVHARVVGYVHVANPCRPRADLTPNAPIVEVGKTPFGKPGWGVANRSGTGSAPRVPVFEVVNQRDMICNADPDSLVRDLGEFIDTMEFHPGAGGQVTAMSILDWLSRAGAEAHARGQLATLLRFGPFRITRAAAEIAGYLGSEHTGYADPRRAPYGNGRTYLDLLGEAVNARLLEMIHSR